MLSIAHSEVSCSCVHLFRFESANCDTPARSEKGWLFTDRKTQAVTSLAVPQISCAERSSPVRAAP